MQLTQERLLGVAGHDRVGAIFRRPAEHGAEGNHQPRGDFTPREDIMPRDVRAQVVQGTNPMPRTDPGGVRQAA
jgi:hypothetical protein